MIKLIINTEEENYDRDSREDYAIRMLRSSTYEGVAFEATEVFIDIADDEQLEDVISSLYLVQKDPISSGDNYNQTDILNKLKT